MLIGVPKADHLLVVIYSATGAVFGRMCAAVARIPIVLRYFATETAQMGRTAVIVYFNVRLASLVSRICAIRQLSLEICDIQSSSESMCACFLWH